VKLRIGRKVYEKAVSKTDTFVQFDIELDEVNVDIGLTGRNINY